MLTIAALGFTPRSARETEDEADPRMVHIARGLLGSKYSIHDLSRFQGEGAENLARFNMPLELGMALGIRYLPPPWSGSSAPAEGHIGSGLGRKKASANHHLYR